MTRIYLVEDDQKIATILKDYLEKYNYAVQLVVDYNHILEEFQTYQPQLVLMDINLPRFDGFYWCRKMRTVSNCPIIFISARDSGMDQVMAIEHGGDDYITKPFQLEVVEAKVKGLLRRTYGKYATDNQKEWIDIDGLRLHKTTMELEFEDCTVTLTKKELLLITAFFEHLDHMLSREYLLELLWDDQHFVDDNTLTVNITRLRKKLAELSIMDAVETVRGAGYKFIQTWGK